MSEVNLSGKAYCKIILHAAKYPHCSVNGVLLAKPSATKSKEIVYVDAIPLFHISLNLIPMAEVALTQIDQYATSLGLCIAGYYTAHENFRENSLEKANHRIADKIAENYPFACLFIVDNKKLSLHLDNIALHAAQFNDGKYRPLDMQKISLSPAATLDACSALLERQVYKSLVDFDNHLDDITMDWTNGQLNQDISDVLKLCGSLC